jgi:hypothetical protein
MLIPAADMACVMARPRPGLSSPATTPTGEPSAKLALQRRIDYSPDACGESPSRRCPLVRDLRFAGRCHVCRRGDMARPDAYSEKDRCCSELNTHQVVTVVLQTKEGKVPKIHKGTTPEAVHREI